ncbi:MAG: 2-amino-4-hydroxy-6-hydroxymethyldihydropteridine diphosphokinase [Bacteroidales bacterium]|nr:2-amino-4-hydroxy-6-hydroxymethyldihydropteridine diphosphokinase [Bacteroidales bacterium]
MSTTAYLLLGSNIGDRANQLKKSIEGLNNNHIIVKRQSNVYETQSWGYDDDDYLNMVVEVETDLQPLDLLIECNIVEASLGRVRYGGGYASRPIDIDILYYGSEIVDKPNLIVPHRLLQDRKFVLYPLCDLIPNFVHPILNKTNKQLLDICKDECKVKLFE